MLALAFLALWALELANGQFIVDLRAANPWSVVLETDQEVIDTDGGGVFPSARKDAIFGLGDTVKIGVVAGGQSASISHLSDLWVMNFATPSDVEWELNTNGLGYEVRGACHLKIGDRVFAFLGWQEEVFRRGPEEHAKKFTIIDLANLDADHQSSTAVVSATQGSPGPSYSTVASYFRIVQGTIGGTTFGEGIGVLYENEMNYIYLYMDPAQTGGSVIGEFWAQGSVPSGREGAISWAVYDAAGMTVGARVYLFGGRAAGTTYSCDLYAATIFSPTTATWSLLEACSPGSGPIIEDTTAVRPSARAFATRAFFAGPNNEQYLIMYGGLGVGATYGVGTLTDAWVYDATSGC